MKKRVYFDTNVLNKLAYVVNYKKIFNRLIENDYVICISEINIFEVIRDQNDKNNIDKITIMLQELNQSNKIIILPSINQILLDYLMDLKTNNSNNNVIIDVINDREKEFIVDNDSVSTLVVGFKKMCKEFNKLIKKVYENCECKTCDSFYCNIKIDEITVLIAHYFLLCNFYIFDEDSVNDFWEKLKIIENKAKEDYINSNLSKILSDNSPYRDIARMIVSQKRNMSNGTFLDGLNMCYLNFVDLLVSDDKYYEIVNKSISLNEFMKMINIKIEFEEE